MPYVVYFTDIGSGGWGMRAVGIESVSDFRHEFGRCVTQQLGEPRAGYTHDTTKVGTRLDLRGSL
jgi:hypothetical protein